MKKLLDMLNHKRGYLVVGFLWILLWVIPWGQLPSIQENLYLAFLTDMARLGVALCVFILSGAMLYILLSQREETDFDLLGIIPIGFTFSVFTVAVIGLAGRLLGFSFTAVKYSFALTGLVELFLVAIFKPIFTIRKKDLSGSFYRELQNPPLIMALVFATMMTFHEYLFFIDDITYLAYIANWQSSTQLGFKNIVHEVEAIEHARFWLAMYPMNQALLSNLSGLPGLLLLGNYLELFLVPLAVLTSYWFARTLGLSRKVAGFSVLIQISLYTWMIGADWPIGTWFYESLAEDKVTGVFLLAPVFFAFVLQYLHRSSKSNLLLVILSGTSLVLTHPIILFLSCVIASGIGIFFCNVSKANWQKSLLLFIVFVGLVMPYVIIRLIDNPQVSKIVYDAKGASVSYEIERYANVVNDVFYGINPSVLKFFDVQLESVIYSAFQLFRWTPFVLVLIAGILSFAKVREGPIHWYILSCVLLVIFATLPYTGWILGYFISARLISRAAWFSPLGLGSALILKTVAGRLRTSRALTKINFNTQYIKINGTIVGLFTCLAFVSPMLVYNILPRVPNYFEKLEHNKQLAQVGSFIDQNTIGQATVIALDYWDTQLLPGVSAHSVLISFREEKDYNGFNDSLSIDVIRERIYASNVIRSLEKEVSDKERCAYIKKFDVRFVLAQPDTVEAYGDKLKKCDLVFENIYKTMNLILIGLK